eukprot:scaffold6241_cov129-Cylindrotheca_fusiformis.AAC.14
MGNQASSTSSGGTQNAAQKAKDAVTSIHRGIKAAAKNLENDGASHLIDNVCGGSYFDNSKTNRQKNPRSNSFSDESDGGTYDDDDETYTVGSRTTFESSRRGGRTLDEDETMASSSYNTECTDDESLPRRHIDSYDSHPDKSSRFTQPLASSFAKRCYFTKAGIGSNSQHYEGLTLTGNVVLMLASAMKLKGCPTICDEDLRRVEQTYPNQFSRLPDELLLSSGWRRISKYCHFSNKPIPDGVPFFHSKDRVHPSGGYYFLLASSVGMLRPIDVEPLTRDTLVLLETDFPNQCDLAPQKLIEDPKEWTLVDKFCFFSGGPINIEEDVYYQADMNGNPIYMLAFLSPSLTPEELYKIQDADEPGLKSMAEVQEVEAVYDLTNRDFDDLKLYHLGPCRALPQYILQPNAWTKVLPPHFVAARNEAIARAQEWQAEHVQDGQMELEMEEEEGALPSPINTSSSTSPESQPVVQTQDLDTDAPNPEGPTASPAIKLSDAAEEVPDPNPSFDAVEEEKKSPAENSGVVNDQADDAIPADRVEDNEFATEPVEDEEFVHPAASESVDVGPEISMDTSIDSLRSGEEHFTVIKREGFRLSTTGPASPTSTASARSTPSAAVRGAQEVIRKKKLKRMEIAKRQLAPHQKSKTGDVDDLETFSMNFSTWDSETEIDMDESFPATSDFKEESELVDKTSRREMILQMAKARMQHADVDSSGWTENPSFPSVSEARTESTEFATTFDVSRDLD